MVSFIQRHMDKVIGKVSGWDRLRFRGTLRMLAHAAGLDRFLKYKRILLQTLSQQTREASLEVARAADRPVVYLRNPQTCKEDIAGRSSSRTGSRKG